MATNEQLLSLLWQAVYSEYGIAVNSNAREILKRRLYAVIYKEAIPEFKTLTFKRSGADASELLILKKEKPDATKIKPAVGESDY